tara:strand:- start:4417 stop:4533 length:117 start_codon:yes stop_codon:yes gene_type:complete
MTGDDLEESIRILTELIGSLGEILLEYSEELIELQEEE